MVGEGRGDDRYFFKFGKLQGGSLALVGRSYHSKIQEVVRELEAQKKLKPVRIGFSTAKALQQLRILKNILHKDFSGRQLRSMPEVIVYPCSLDQPISNSQESVTLGELLGDGSTEIGNQLDLAEFMKLIRETTEEEFIE